MRTSFNKEERNIRINLAYKFEDLILKFESYKPSRDTILCPFHDDHKPSAKIFHDSNGDKIYCFSEGKMFTIVDYLTLKKQDLDKWDVSPNLPDSYIDNSFKELDYSKLDGFVKREFDIKEFLLRLFYIV